MTTDFTQFAERFQEQTLAAVKQAQDLNVAALEQTQKFFAEVATMDKVSLEPITSPTKFVELSFDYANKFFEMRKQYALQVAEMVETATKNFSKTISEN
jgi:hypothetical protein